jgi:hypothetical protein
VDITNIYDSYSCSCLRTATQLLSDHVISALSFRLAGGDILGISGFTVIVVEGYDRKHD